MRLVRSMGGWWLACARAARAMLALGLLAQCVASGAAVAEAPTDRLMIAFRNASAPPRAAVAASGHERIDALALRSIMPMRYLRTMYDGSHVVHLGRFMHGQELAAAVARLAADPQVDRVAPDRVKRIQATMPNDPRAAATVASPNGEFTQQWYLLAPNATLISPIDAVGAWDYSRGSASVPVAVIDTGVLFRHPDLGTVANGGKLLPGYDMVSSDAGSSPPTFYVANDGNGADPDPTDPGDWISSADLSNPATAPIFASPAAGCTVAPSSWHGTLVSGIIGASTNNGIGIAGVGWNSPVLPVRALGKCIGYDSDIIDAMAWAAGIAVPYPDPTSVTPPANPNPVRIINLSLGGPGACSSFYSSIIGQLTAMNVVVIAAAGNGAGAAGAGGAVTEPANCAGVIAVGALRYTGTKVGFSNLGPEVAISAPGGNCLSPTVTSGPPCVFSIVSTSNTETETASDAGMGYVDGNQPTVTFQGQPFVGGGEFGTSFSTPMVAGVVALMLAANPNLTPAQVLTLLEFSSRPFPAPGSVPICPNADPTTSECACPPPTVAATSTTPASGGQCGAGMLDARQAVLAAINAIPAVPSVLPAPTPISAPVIPPPPPQASASKASSSGSGGSGVTAPWWILLVLAFAAMRARTTRKPEAGGRVS